MHLLLVMCSCFPQGTDFSKTFHAVATTNNIQQDRLAHSTTVRNVMKRSGPFVLVSLTSIKCKHLVCFTCGCLCGPPSRPDTVSVCVCVCVVPVVIGMQHMTLGYRESCLMSPFVSERHSSSAPPLATNCSVRLRALSANGEPGRHTSLSLSH